MPQKDIRGFYFSVKQSVDLQGRNCGLICFGNDQDYCEIRKIGKDNPRCERGCQFNGRCMKMLASSDLEILKIEQGHLTAHWCSKKSKPFLLFIPKGLLHYYEKDFLGYCPLCINKGRIVKAGSKKMPLLFEYSLKKEIGGEKYTIYYIEFGLNEHNSDEFQFKADFFMEHERVFLCFDCHQMIRVSLGCLHSPSSPFYEKKYFCHGLPIINNKIKLQLFKSEDYINNPTIDKFNKHVNNIYGNRENFFNKLVWNKFC